MGWLIGAIVALGVLLITEHSARAQEIKICTAHINRAWDYKELSTGEIDAIVAGCTRAIESGSSRSRDLVIEWGSFRGQGLAIFYFARGEAYDAKQDFDRAIADYSETIRLDPASVRAWENRGNAFAERGVLRDDNADIDQAMADWKEAIRLDPKGANLRTLRVTTAVFKYRRERTERCENAARNDKDRVIADCTAAIEAYSKHDLSFYHRANAYRDAGDFDRAIADYTEAIRLEPRDAEYLDARCRARGIGNRELQEALADCTEAIRHYPAGPAMLMGHGPYSVEPPSQSRGFIYLRLGRLDDAIADYDKALRYSPDLAASLYGRGLARIGKGDIARGKADIAAAKKKQADIAEEFARYGVKGPPPSK